MVFDGHGAVEPLDLPLSNSSGDSGENAGGSDNPVCNGRHAKLSPIKSPNANGVGHSAKARAGGAGVDDHVDDTAASMSGSEYERGE